MEEKAVCLISGGIDSCVAATIAKHQGYALYALTFDYGQLHNKEITAAKKFASKLNVTDHLQISFDLSQFGGSALTKSQDKAIPETTDVDQIGRRIPPTYVPARNIIFLSFGLSYAEAINATTIFIGVNAIDYSGYPDCRPQFIKAFQHMANLGTKRGTEGKPIGIKTPLIRMTKADIITRGIQLGAPLEKTWSCYRGDKKPCGTCESCLLRLKGFQEAGHPDPLDYTSLPEWYTPTKKSN